MLDKNSNNNGKSGFDNFPTFDTLWINKDKVSQPKKKRKKMNGFQKQVKRTKRQISRRIIGGL